MSMKIDTQLVSKLITSQFPEWAQLPLKPVEPGGWDNRTFRLGDNMSVRLPSGEAYSHQVQKEQLWLPKLSPHLLVQIPSPIGMGKPQFDFPWSWSIYSWIEGETLSLTSVSNQAEFAEDLADFLLSLQKIDSKNGPQAGIHNFYRGGSLTVYDTETRNAISKLADQIDVREVTQIWEAALASTWSRSPVWVHGDVSVGNLLVKNGRLSAVIDFGMLGVGDPACDLVMMWNFFDLDGRKAFKERLILNSIIDEQTWTRAKGWALWKSLIVLAGHPASPQAVLEARNVVNLVLAENSVY